MHYEVDSVLDVGDESRVRKDCVHNLPLPQIPNHGRVVVTACNPYNSQHVIVSVITVVRAITVNVLSLPTTRARATHADYFPKETELLLS